MYTIREFGNSSYWLCWNTPLIPQSMPRKNILEWAQQRITEYRKKRLAVAERTEDSQKAKVFSLCWDRFCSTTGPSNSASPKSRRFWVGTFEVRDGRRSHFFVILSHAEIDGGNSVWTQENTLKFQRLLHEKDGQQTGPNWSMCDMCSSSAGLQGRYEEIPLQRSIHKGGELATLDFEGASTGKAVFQSTDWEVSE